MYKPEIPPPTTTTSQDNGLKDDFSSSGRKIEKIEFKGYRKAVNVRFSSRRGRACKRELNKVFSFRREALPRVSNPKRL